MKLNAKKSFSNIFPNQLLSACRTTLDKTMSPVILSIPDSIKLIQDHQDQLSAILTTAELNQLFGYSHSIRKNEFLCGRISAKIALINFLTNQQQEFPAFNQISITNHASGRPTVHVLNGEDRNFKGGLSISHSKKYGCALVSEMQCGIDIQVPTDTLQKVKEKYCIEKEETILTYCLPDHSPIQRLCLLWTAKEAIKKSLSYLRLIGFQSMLLADCVPETESICFLTFKIVDHAHMPQTITTVSSFFNKYGLSLTTTRTRG